MQANKDVNIIEFIKNNKGVSVDDIKAYQTKYIDAINITIEYAKSSESGELIVESLIVESLNDVKKRVDINYVAKDDPFDALDAAIRYNPKSIVAVAKAGFDQKAVFRRIAYMSDSALKYQTIEKIISEGIKPSHQDVTEVIRGIYNRVKYGHICIESVLDYIDREHNVDIAAYHSIDTIKKYVDIGNIDVYRLVDITKYRNISSELMFMAKSNEAYRHNLIKSHYFSPRDYKYLKELLETPTVEPLGDCDTLRECIWRRYDCDVSLVDAFVESGINLETKNGQGCTVIMFAARFSHPDVVRRLLEHGADVSASDTDNKNALWYAINYLNDTSSVDSVKILLAWGARITLWCPESLVWGQTPRSLKYVTQQWIKSNNIDVCETNARKILMTPNSYDKEILHF